MVTFQIESPFTPEMESLIPDQRECFRKLFEKGKLLSYTVGANRKTMWAILLVEAESELVNILDKFPMSYFLTYQYQEVYVHETISMVPSMSLN